MPIAFVCSTHSDTLGVKVNNPACFLKCSDSNTLKFGLYISSQVAKNSSVLLFLSQLRTTSAALESSDFAAAISVMQLWEMATECPVVFPSGVGVVEWMVPGERDIAVATSKLMKEYDVAIWAHHGMFCSGEDFDLTFGLMHTVEKAAEILVKMLSMRSDKMQTITSQNFRDLARDFNVNLPEKFL